MSAAVVTFMSLYALASGTLAVTAIQAARFEVSHVGLPQVTAQSMMASCWREE